MNEQERPSKTQRKKQMHELQALGERLVELSPEQLAHLALPEDLHDALLEARRVPGRESRRRHMQYIGRLMRRVDPAPIRDRLEILDGRSHEQIARQHAIERWRERLLVEDGALQEFSEGFAVREWEALRELVIEARRERREGRTPRRYRELFQAIKEILRD